MLYCKLFPGKKYLDEWTYRHYNGDEDEDEDDYTPELRVTKEQVARREYLDETCSDDTDLLELEICARFLEEVVAWGQQRDVSAHLLNTDDPFCECILSLGKCCAHQQEQK